MPNYIKDKRYMKIDPNVIIIRYSLINIDKQNLILKYCLEYLYISHCSS